MQQHRVSPQPNLQSCISWSLNHRTSQNLTEPQSDFQRPTLPAPHTSNGQPMSSPSAPARSATVLSFKTHYVWGEISWGETWKSHNSEDIPESEWNCKKDGAQLLGRTL